MKAKHKEILKGLLKKYLKNSFVWVYPDAEPFYLIPNEADLNELAQFMKNNFEYIDSTYTSFEIKNIISSIFHMVYINDETLKKLLEDCRNNLQSFDINSEARSELRKKIKLAEKFGGKVNLIASHGELRIENLKNLSASLIKFIDSVVWEFENPTKSKILVQLASISVKNDMNLSEDIAIIKNIDNYSLANEKVDFNLDKTKAYISIAQKGLVGKLFPSTKNTLITKLKTFLGLALIGDVFKLKDIKEISEFGNDPSVGIFWPVLGQSIIFRTLFKNYYDKEIEEKVFKKYEFTDDQKKDIINSVYNEVAENDYRCIETIKLSEEYKKLLNSLYYGKKVQIPGLRIIENGEEILLDKIIGEQSEEYVSEEAFIKIKRVLCSEDEYAKRIRSAAYWFTEGFCCGNDTMKFINYTIAIEALLGTRDHKIPLTETLSDRLGFYLGKNLKESFKIKKLFKNIYDIRSDIVHEGKAVLFDNKKGKDLEEISIQIIKDFIFTF